MIIDPEIKEKVIQHTYYWFNKASPLLGIALPLPEIEFTQRGAVAAQTFTYRDEENNIVKTRLNYNPYYIVEDPQKFMEQTIPHEVAHIFQHALHPQSKPHGIEWIGIMKKFGVTPEIYTDIHVDNPVPQAKLLHLYQCMECGAKKVFNKKEHDQFEGKLKLPECEKCGGVMEFVRKAQL
jgi:SprT protein